MTRNTSQGTIIRHLVRAMRPSHWTKNIVVLAAFFFAMGDVSRKSSLGIREFMIAFSGMLLFCIASSGIYIINDIKDAQADRSHPVKKNRPIASGALPISTALWTALALLATACIGSYLLSPPFACVVGSYLGIQILYNIGLKKIALIDILSISIGFVLRAIAGAIILAVNISPWLLLCTFLLAMFLALCKRRREKMQVDDNGGNAKQRPALDNYDEHLLDQLIAIVSSATIVSYAIYTLSPDTISKFGTANLGFTIPFVLFGIFRYLDLVYRHSKGEQPEKTLLTDMPILINIALYGTFILIIFALKKDFPM